jgi:hypothetical protein
VACVAVGAFRDVQWRALPDETDECFNSCRTLDLFVDRGIMWLVRCSKLCTGKRKQTAQT